MTTLNKDEHDLISAIARRACALAANMGAVYPQIDAVMDITAVHTHGNPLRLADLAAADAGNFGHDVFGIRRHINRETGKLEDCFSPRYSKPAVTWSSEKCEVCDRIDCDIDHSEELNEAEAK